MPVLKVRCTKCRPPVETGFDVDFDTFLALTETERTLECPYGEETQTRRCSRGELNAEQPLGVAVRDLLLVGVADR
jgi:hypothetical protein